jgi:hypothetical protein
MVSAFFLGIKSFENGPPQWIICRSKRKPLLLLDYLVSEKG